MTITDTTQSIGEFLAQNAAKIDELSQQHPRGAVIATFLEIRESVRQAPPAERHLKLVNGGEKV